MTSLADMHQSYERAELLESTAHADPFAQFRQWLDDALAGKVQEPNAMTLATVGASGRPSTRVVLIKNFDARGVVWFSNYASRKGRELAQHPFAALQFHWLALERVVRIEGRVDKIDAGESDAYYASRPLGSRIGAWASPQSQVIANRATLDEAVAAAQARFGAAPPRPDNWGGYRLKPDAWEFWQGRKNRLHDRLSYRLHDGQWVRERLAP